MLSKDTEAYQKALGYVQMLKLEGKPDEEAVAELKQMYRLTTEEANDILHTFKTEKKDIYTAQIWSNVKLALGPLMYCAVVAVIYFALGSVGGTLTSINTIYALLFVLAGIGVLGVILGLLRERIEVTSLFKFVSASRVYQRYVTKKTIRSFVVVIGFVFIYFHFISNSVADTSNWTEVNNLVLTEDCKEIVINGKTKNQYYLFTTEQTSKDFKWFQNDHFYQFTNGISSPDKYFRAGDTISIWVDKKELIYESSIFDQSNEVYNVAKKGEAPVLDLISRNRAASQQNKKTMLVLAVLFIFMMILSRYENKRPATFKL